MAAVEEGNPPIEVLFALHPNFNLMDYAGPLEAFHTAQHNFKDPSKMPDASMLLGPEAALIRS